jgi:hypothetical protein
MLLVLPTLSRMAGALRSVVLVSCLPHRRRRSLILDSSLYTGSITYVDVTENSQYWEIPMQSEPSFNGTGGS